jgi:hypothetical protein
MRSQTLAVLSFRAPWKKKIVKRIVPKLSHMYYYFCIESLYITRVPVCTTMQENNVD